MTPRFKIGDRVRRRDDRQLGTVVFVNNGYYSIETDEYSGGHTCGKHAKIGHGWFMSADSLVPVPTDPFYVSVLSYISKELL